MQYRVIAHRVATADAVKIDNMQGWIRNPQPHLICMKEWSSPQVRQAWKPWRKCSASKIWSHSGSSRSVAAAKACIPA